jgi:hypothetical protein
VSPSPRDGQRDLLVRREGADRRRHDRLSSRVVVAVLVRESRNLLEHPLRAVDVRRHVRQLRLTPPEVRSGLLHPARRCSCPLELLARLRAVDNHPRRDASTPLRISLDPCRFHQAVDVRRWLR